MNKTYRQLYEMVESHISHRDRNNGVIWWKIFERFDMRFNRGAMTSSSAPEGRE